MNEIEALKEENAKMRAILMDLIESVTFGGVDINLVTDCARRAYDILNKHKKES